MQIGRELALLRPDQQSPVLRSAEPSAVPAGLASDFGGLDARCSHSKLADVSMAKHLTRGSSTRRWDSRLCFIQRFGHFLREVWSEPAWSFRAPSNIDELARFIDLEIRAVGALFFSSDYNAPYIVGSVQIEAIPAPHNAVTLGSGAPTSRRG